jgi:hypothetical protein
MRSVKKFCFILFLFYSPIYSQITFIKDVPDYNQPPAQSLPSTIDISNYCAPFAALNIIAYWDSTAQHPLAKGVMGSLPPKEAAEYIGWFMDTNNNGSLNRNNLSEQGTYVSDQGPGILEYFQFDSVNHYGFPPPFPQNKISYFLWDVGTELTPPFPTLMQEINDGNPVKLDFLHWNIQKTGYKFFDPAVSEDTIYIYQWDVPVDTSAVQGPENPSEKWNLEAGESNIGHAVTCVGYMPAYTPPNSILPPDDYVIVHDNWRTTPKDIAIPWQDFNIAMPSVTAIIWVRPPYHPDLTITTVKASNDTAIGYSDTLTINYPVSVSTTITESKGFPIPPFILVSGALDLVGTVINEDTLIYPTAPNKQQQTDSIVVFFDSLFTPIATGDYTIYSQVFWDQNSDGKINDPADADTGNDHYAISTSVLYYVVYTQLHLIPNVPDLNQPQPPNITLPFTLPFNFCAPTAAANILLFWDIIVNHQNAINVTAGLPGETLAEYIGWFMDTNNKGNPAAYNGRIYQAASGTYTIDQDSLLREYVRWDAANPAPIDSLFPVQKSGYDWIYQADYSGGYSLYQPEIQLGHPVKADFAHWNISFSGTLFIDSLTQDTAYLYNWGIPVKSSAQADPAAPEEDWNLEEDDQNIGHAVTGVGFVTGLPFGSFYAVVHDNWATTPRNIVIPWLYQIATFAMEPQTVPAVEKLSVSAPSFELFQNYPNPFNSNTRILYRLPTSSDVSITIYNNLGQIIRKIILPQQSSGPHSFIWNAQGMSSGIYYFKLEAGPYRAIIKCLLLR